MDAKTPAGRKAPVRADLHAETLAATALGREDRETGAVVPPVYLNTTYCRDPDNGYSRGRVYGRVDNPTFDIAADTLNALEGGAETILFASGMAAATSVFLALDPGDHVVVPRVMYWSLRNWLKGFAARWGLQIDIVDTSDIGALRVAIRPGKTRLVWLETPGNPLWTISDIEACAEAAHSAEAMLAVNSTVATPVLTQPIALGADIVMHSATKYLNGHSDVLAGTLTTACKSEFWARIKTVQLYGGGIPGAFEAWLLQRGMRTLFPRVRWQCASAQTLAERLSEHPAVHAVLYPGLPGFPGHELARRQMRGGFGGMLSIRIAGGEAAAIVAAGRVKVWKRATSLGGVESLIEHRASIEGHGSPVPRDLLRLSVGLEAVDDLFDDLRQAFALKG